MYIKVFDDQTTSLATIAEIVAIMLSDLKPAFLADSWGSVLKRSHSLAIVQGMALSW